MTSMDGGAGGLVEAGVRRYGRLAGRPGVVDPLAEFGGVGRALRGLRLKEWVGFTLLHPQWYASLIVQDAHYLASSELYAYDRASGELHQHAVAGRGGSVALPAELFGGRCLVERPGYRIEYRFARAAGAGRHRLRFDIAGAGRAPGVEGELELDAERASRPLSVSSRLPGGRMYTHKAVFPVSGVLRVGERELVFDPARDLAILDEHRSLLPYRTSWLWGTFAMPTDDGPVGANFAARPELPGEPEESCLWTPGVCEPLADVAFERHSAATGADPLAPLRMRSRDGRLDVVFEPEGRKRVKHQLGLFAVDYFQLFGRYRGTLRGADRTYRLRDVHGVCESMRARL